MVRANPLHPLPHTYHTHWDAGPPTLLMLSTQQRPKVKKNIGKVVSGLVAPAHGNPRIYWSPPRKDISSLNNTSRERLR